MEFKIFQRMLFLSGLVIAASSVVRCSGQGASTAPSTSSASNSSTTDTTSFVPLIDMGQNTYQGFQGGLYPNASNDLPSPHKNEGSARAKRIQPLDTNGNANASGKIVLLSIGFSNATMEFCASGGNLTPCDSWTFMGQAAADPAVNHTTLMIANGAFGGRAASAWVSATSTEYDRIRDSVLAPQGLSEAQVQVIWFKTANPSPTTSLPSTQADAYQLEASFGNAMRALKTRYPNVQQVFLSSRTYGGYATSNLNPEPYAYESGFAVKWLVQAQIAQMQQGNSAGDTHAGDLNYTTVAPWIAWGPYLWTNDSHARSDGLTWDPTDVVASDHTHPSQSGQQKVGTLLLNFFKSSDVTSCWFLAGKTCS